jgi:hypothetical protein
MQWRKISTVRFVAAVVASEQARRSRIPGRRLIIVGCRSTF